MVQDVLLNANQLTWVMYQKKHNYKLEKVKLELLTLKEDNVSII